MCGIMVSMFVRLQHHVAALALAALATLTVVACGSETARTRETPTSSLRGTGPTAADAPATAPPLARAGGIAAAAPAAVAQITPVPAPTAAPSPAADRGFRLRIPYRTQFDGSTFEWGNCGVSAITMAMEHYGRPFETHDVRLDINRMTGNWDLKVGVDWRYLIRALEGRGFKVDGPYAERSGYITWTLDDVLARVTRGQPVMLMAHYRSLPGHEEDEWIGDHYILVVGYTGDGKIVYHDPGFPGETGAYMTIDRERLERAWSTTWIGQNRTAMVILPPG
jgi:hypothetical protein